ncbi:MAG: hypothetical protein ACTSRG_14700 [Candidatus Helarchaeota archaeon]
MTIHKNNKKVSAFDKFLLNEVQKFTDDTFVISAENTKEEFYKYMQELLNEDEIDDLVSKEEFIKNIKEDWVHFHIN